MKMGKGRTERDRKEHRHGRATLSYVYSAMGLEGNKRAAPRYTIFPINYVWFALFAGRATTRSQKFLFERFSGLTVRVCRFPLVSTYACNLTWCIVLMEFIIGLKSTAELSIIQRIRNFRSNKTYLLRHCNVTRRRSRGLLL